MADGSIVADDVRRIEPQESRMPQNAPRNPEVLGALRVAGRWRIGRSRFVT